MTGSVEPPFLTFLLISLSISTYCKGEMLPNTSVSVAVLPSTKYVHPCELGKVLKFKVTLEALTGTITKVLTAKTEDVIAILDKQFLSPPDK